MVYAGIDPGASGGLALIGTGGSVSALSMPSTERDVWDWIDLSGAEFAVIERVGGFIQGNPAPGSAMFNFGKGYGGVRMALIAAGIPFEEVTPQKWQAAMGVPKRKKTESKGQHKNKLKAIAQQLFPAEKVTLKTCDAILLAEYCRRMREGK